jgi:hypothetical protein
MVKKDADLSAGKLRTRAQPGSSSKSKEGSLLPVMHMMYPVSIITTIKNLFTRRVIIIIIFKKKKEEGKKNCSQRNLDSNIIYNSCTIDLKLKLQ